ncbi:hypothetical protein [Streptomyces sp. NPDC047009]|uniref:hypothetical protein n=1 Tax=unclassified Streptomyces TaxID=2593676 RepID=UPI0033E0A9E4
MERLDPLLDGLAGGDGGQLDGLDSVVQVEHLLLMDRHGTPDVPAPIRWCGTSFMNGLT